MIDQETSSVMDNLVRPLLDNESRELDRRVTRAAEWAVQAGVPGSGLAFFKRIAAYFDHYKELAGAVWAAMLRVLDETDIRSSPDLAGDLKQKFDAYLSAPAQRTRSSMVALGQMGHAMPRETFDTVFEETRTKFHAEIELRCRRARGGNEAAQIRIGELNMGDTYTARQVGAMGPGAHAHDMSLHQVSAQQLGHLDMRTLAVELSSLRREMKQIATEPEHDIAIGQIAAAETAAQKGDAGTVLRHLKSAGKWGFDVATKIGVSVASEAIKKSIGL
jgi:hypothetical protein